ncbi:MAG: hypothetical protein SGBAC_000516 [Bacillariaceae sp.]
MKYSDVVSLLYLSSFAEANIANTDALKIATALPRGGWFGGGNKGSEKYLKSLEQEVVILGRRERQAREEVAILRESRKHRASVVVKQDKDSKEQAVKLEEENKALKSKLKELENEKDELSSALETSKEQVVALDKTLASELKKNDETVGDMENKIQELKASVDEKIERMTLEHKKTSDARIALAMEEATLNAEQEFDSKIKKVEADLLKSNEEALANERTKAAEAVDAEKKKMRKLVKALAQREKELSAQR